MTRLVIILFLFSINAFAKNIVVYKDHPLLGNPKLEVLTYYDDENFMGYHTVVTEVIPHNGEDVKVIYESKATQDTLGISPQHSHGIFYAMHLQKTCQLLSQNQSNSTDSDSDDDDEVWEFEERTVGLLYPIAEGCE